MFLGILLRWQSEPGLVGVAGHLCTTHGLLVFMISFCIGRKGDDGDG